jgi:GntR family transcriptional regulator
MDQINRISKLPLYQQLYDILRESISRGEWKPGDLIPPESELIEKYQVSRITVRQVLDMLVKDGLIYRQRGRGSFVAHPAVEQVMQRVVSFTDDMTRRGFAPSTQVLRAGLMPAPKDIAACLSIEPGAELAQIVRVRLADGEPMSVEESYLVHRYCQGILKYDFSINPLREILDKEFDVRWAYAHQSIRAMNASKDLAKNLSIPVNAAVLFIERVSYSQNNIPIEFLRIYNRGDRYSLQNDLRG